jgi:hypothetical protein
MFKKSKKTFFKGDSKGKRAFKGKFGGKQKKTALKKKVEQKKTLKVETPEQKMTQSPARAPQKMQMHLRPTPKQPRFMANDEIMKRLRRVTQ